MTAFFGSDGAVVRERGPTRYVRVDLYETAGPAGDVRIEGRAPAAAHLRGAHANVRAGALLTMLDSVGGICGGLAALPDGWVVTTNLAARTVRLDHTGPFRLDARVLRRGRNSVVTAIEIHDTGARDAIVADGVLTSAILVPENGPPQWQRPLTLVVPDDAADALALPEWLGLRVLNGTTIEITLTDALRNPWGILHGGVVAALVDAAAENATGGITTDVVLHFLAPNRTGPVRAEARPFGTRSDGEVMRVEVRDEGAGRVTAVAIVTTVAASDRMRDAGVDVV